MRVRLVAAAAVRQRGAARQVARPQLGWYQVISVIVPIYVNRRGLYPVIERCLASLRACSPDAELILVDDCSPLPTKDWPVSHCNMENLGYTATVNVGLRLATGCILIVANDDVVFTPAVIAACTTIGDGVYSPRTSDEVTGDRFGALWGMRRSTFEKLGYLDEQMKHFCSDLDYYARAKALGIPVVKWANITVEHVGGATYRYTPKSTLYARDVETYERKRRSLGSPS